MLLPRTCNSFVKGEKQDNMDSVTKMAFIFMKNDFNE